jgi:hypothetical protein
MTTNQVRAGGITRTDRLCLSANFLRTIAIDIIIDRPARLLIQVQTKEKKYSLIQATVQEWLMPLSTSNHVSK